MIDVCELTFSYRGWGPNRASSFGMQVQEFTVPVGACTALVGPSGSGKTTLLGLIAGTLRATSGGLASAVSAAFDILSSDVDLEIGMTVSEDQPAPGATVVYTISVTNHGPRSATGVQITGDLPSRMSFVAASASRGSYDPENGVWTVGTLADGAIATLSITVTVNGLANASS